MKRIIYAVGAILLTGGGYYAYNNSTSTTKPTPIDPPKPNTITVTSLNDYKPWDAPIEGSLRWAISKAKAGDIIEFSKGGNIDLAESLSIKTAGITIDGSSAPSPGITIQRNQVTVWDTNRIVLRNLRFRSSFGFASDADRKAVHGEYDFRPGIPDSGGIRSLVIYGDKALCSDILVENCSCEYSTDDNASVWGNCQRITLRRCLFGGGIARVYLENGDSVLASKGLLAGVEPGLKIMDLPDYLTIDRCVFPFLAGRAPDVTGGVVQLTYNVICGSRQGGIFTLAKANIIGNWCMSLPNHPWGVNADRQLVAESAITAKESFFLASNFLDGKPSTAVIGERNKGQTDLPAYVFRSEAWPGMPLLERVAPGESMARNVLDEAGCILPERDDVDKAQVAAVYAIFPKS